MKRFAVTLFLLISWPAFGDTTSFIGPSGKPVYKTSCKSSTADCYQEASRYCRGAYQIVSSESHAGGLFADLIPGPVTWYSMSYACGPSDGRLASFPFRGRQYQAPRPAYVNCDAYTNNVQCWGYN
jgi:hypothetical protein